MERITRWMGLDVGIKRIGVAVTDPLKLTATPLLTFDRQSIARDVSIVLQLVEEYSVEKIVVGRPVHLSGAQSDTVGSIETLVSALREASSLSIEWAEERLSTKESERLMSDLRLSVPERRAKRDQFAAALILTWYLGEQSNDTG